MSVYLVARGEGSTPVYRQIRDALANEIRERYRSGEFLPPEGELAERFSVHRHTLRRAIDELVADGFVQRFHGKGVFVVEPAISYAIVSNTRFTETLESLGITTKSQVLRKQVIPATRGIASKLKIKEGVEVVFVETLRAVEAKPFCVISHFIPSQMCPEIFEHYDSGSLHRFIKKSCGIEVKREESLVSAVLPEAGDTRLLNMPRHAPILRVKSTNVDVESGRPVEYAVTRFRGDAIQLLFQP